MSSKEIGNNYDINKRRVCEIYGVDPSKASTHHIVFKRDVKNGLVDEFPINQLSNLYPFYTNGRESREAHTTVEDHQELHRQVDSNEQYTHTKRGKRKRKYKVIYQAKRR